MNKMAFWGAQKRRPVPRDTKERLKRQSPNVKYPEIEYDEVMKSDVGVGKWTRQIVSRTVSLLTFR